MFLLVKEHAGWFEGARLSCFASCFERLSHISKFRVEIDSERYNLPLFQVQGLLGIFATVLRGALSGALPNVGTVLICGCVRSILHATPLCLGRCVRD